VEVVFPGFRGGRAKGANREGGGVERSRAGDNKDKLAKDVRGEIEGGIRAVSGESKF
jgi:hypothetical protein